MKFKVGDEVRHINPESTNLRGVVLSVQETDYYPYRIKWDCGVGEVSHSEDQLSLMTPLDKLL